MATVRITEAELARDIHAVLVMVQHGVEVIVEQDHRPVAVIRTPQSPGRKIGECIALAKAYEERLGYAPMPDRDFAKDVQAAIEAHREPRHAEKAKTSLAADERRSTPILKKTDSSAFISVDPRLKILFDFLASTLAGAWSYGVSSRRR